MRRWLSVTFSSLSVRNYRLFFLGQFASISGIWMQQIAVAWLVLRLTNSALAVGLTIAFQTLPYLVLGAWAGVVVDRLPKRRLLICTQLGQAVPPILLWMLTESGSTRIWMVYAVTLCRGLLNAFDNPARQSFVGEMVSRDKIVNAVSLNASLSQFGRLFGPAIAAVIIATLGLGPCFLANSASYLVMAAMVVMMRQAELTPAPVTPRGKGQIRAGLTLAARTPELRVPLALMGFVGLFSFNFNVVIPTVARFTYHGTATTYALMMNSLAGGALVGALASGTRSVVTRRTMSWASLGLGVSMGLTAVVDNLALALIGLAAVGATSVTFSASIQSALQLGVKPEMRGRILSLYQVLYQGTTPLGAIMVGVLAATLGARSGLIVGSAAALVAGVLGLWGPAAAKRGAAGSPEPSELGA